MTQQAAVEGWISHLRRHETQRATYVKSPVACGPSLCCSSVRKRVKVMIFVLTSEFFPIDAMMGIAGVLVLDVKGKG